MRKPYGVVLLVAWSIVSLILASFIVGCAPVHSASGPLLNDPVNVTHPLHHVLTWTEIFMVAGIPIIAAGVALLVVGLFNPIGLAAHKASTFLMVGGGALFGVSAFLRVSLWLIPWLVYGTIGLGVIFAAYEVYVKVSKRKDIPDLLGGIQYPPAMGG